MTDEDELKFEWKQLGDWISLDLDLDQDGMATLVANGTKERFTIEECREIANNGSVVSFLFKDLLKIKGLM